MSEQKMNLGTPIAIVAAGALIAGALYFAGGAGSPSTGPAGAPDAGQPAVPIAEVQADDHIVGNADAKVVIVEYSDTECPFCKNHHETLKEITSKYEASEVAWVYRNFPIPQLHPNAPKQAEALECAAELGGNEGFWAYTDRLYEVTPSNNGLSMDELPKIATHVGLDAAAFTQCLDSGDMQERVDADYNEVIAAGGRGTPHNILLVNGEQYPLEGGQSVEGLSQIIDQLLAQ
ncbi:thioredoxin domain-containing protein [Candidatus Kaiserbacteria bacterium]|nr:MAG: thioredoxin domain-containing protein [Candidatus Kaiserbacteria bacterium]